MPVHPLVQRIVTVHSFYGNISGRGFEVRVAGLTVASAPTEEAAGLLAEAFLKALNESLEPLVDVYEASVDFVLKWAPPEKLMMAVKSAKELV